MNIQRISAIFEKDIKDFMKNMMLLVLPVIPIVTALMFDGIGEDKLPLALSYVIVGGTFSTVTSSCIMTMMAEENEKKTLRGLIQSPASLLDIIVGKSLVTGLITLISLVVSLMIIGIEPFLNFRVFVGLILLFLFFLLLGIGIGLFSKSLAATSAYLMPVIFLLGFTPMLNAFGFAEDSMAIKITDMFPVMQAIEIHDTNSWLPMGILAVWIIGAGLFTYVCFRKSMTDD
ncbi:ABC transporter permease [Virgibacillus salexigens]|uniref:ABC-type transport system involved in multi-copper enzyme maturation, permease component n=1 Tax=Virgibacillus massiliensis TaxID=1462526 RepID=A0A024QFK7_9BACI|nr:ABC transporter permease [Virgibacillus massiliensis]CDQ41294.1 ABC-type transport system involved in multi-copper enzyme maturation, permease component [Virgibacillus massiliensis]